MSSGLPWLAMAMGGVKDLENAEAGAWTIPPDSTFPTVVSAVLEFADRIVRGEFRSEILTSIYNERYSASRVAALWDEIFEVAEAGRLRA